MFWLGILCGVLMIIILLLLCKIISLHGAAREICADFTLKLEQDTNTLISLSSRDPYMRRLALELNIQLRFLRLERRRFQQGDLELKEAVTNIAHDLRTPLTAICGYLDLLERGETTADGQHLSYVSSEAAKRYLSMIKNRSEMLKQLTEELFRYSVIISTKDETRELLSLNRVLEDSLASYYGALTGRQIIPVISIPKQEVTRTLNHAALSRILGNVLSNSLKYSDGDLRVTLLENGTMIFTNTAENLTPVMVGRLFDRFYTVETAVNSTGLGLSIAKLLTERMGGSITADYKDKKISITLHFPADS
ncbi:hypothetical protein HNQ56_004382 [Anaerotaenia torta]|uniref:sensor histidine kinase n=1 Tax=Anaerotaenia torta TaxID=433293 RepID=UPI003D1F2EDD